MTNQSFGPLRVILGKRVKVSWNVSDPDTKDTGLMFEIAYSPNNGRSWVPVAVDVPGTQRSTVFRTAKYRRAERTGEIAVFVSDGLNTASGFVAGLTLA